MFRQQPYPCPSFTWDKTDQLPICKCPSIFNCQRSRLQQQSVRAGYLCPPLRIAALVGLGRIELPTSPLSGVRSSHLSYRPSVNTGGAGRDRTGDLLNANQALSQLSYSPKISPLPRGRGSEINRGQLDAGTGISRPLATLKRTP